jgi:hypothetical protein
MNQNNKYIFIMFACLLISACGNSSKPKSFEEHINYYCDQSWDQRKEKINSMDDGMSKDRAMADFSGRSKIDHCKCIQRASKIGILYFPDDKASLSTWGGDSVQANHLWPHASPHDDLTPEVRKATIAKYVKDRSESLDYLYQALQKYDWNELDAKAVLLAEAVGSDLVSYDNYCYKNDLDKHLAMLDEHDQRLEIENNQLLIEKRQAEEREKQINISLEKEKEEWQIKMMENSKNEYQEYLNSLKEIRWEKKIPRNYSIPASHVTRGGSYTYGPWVDDANARWYEEKLEADLAELQSKLRDGNISEDEINWKMEMMMSSFPELNWKDR